MTLSTETPCRACAAIHATWGTTLRHAAYDKTHLHYRLKCSNTRVLHDSPCKHNPKVAEYGRNNVFTRRLGRWSRPFDLAPPHRLLAAAHAVADPSLNFGRCSLSSMRWLELPRSKHALARTLEVEDALTAPFISSSFS